MALQQFKTASLATLDGGRIAAALERELKQAVQDCRDRPAEKKARKVTLQIEIAPEVVDNTADLCTIGLQCQIQARFPSRASRTYSMDVQKNGNLVFNADAPENPAQKTIFDGEGEQTHDAPTE